MTNKIEIVKKEAVRLESGMIDMNSVSFQTHKLADRIIEETKHFLRTNCTIEITQSHGKISYKGEAWSNQEIMLTENNKLFDIENTIDNGTGELTEEDALDDFLYLFALEISKQIIGTW